MNITLKPIIPHFSGCFKPSNKRLMAVSRLFEGPVRKTGPAVQSPSILLTAIDVINMPTFTLAALECGFRLDLERCTSVQTHILIATAALSYRAVLPMLTTACSLYSPPRLTSNHHPPPSEKYRFHCTARTKRRRALNEIRLRSGNRQSRFPSSGPSLPSLPRTMFSLVRGSGRSNPRHLAN